MDDHTDFVFEVARTYLWSAARQIDDAALNMVRPNRTLSRSLCHDLSHDIKKLIERLDEGLTLMKDDLE